MALGDYRIRPGLVTEEIGQEILVCDTDLAVVHRVSGPAADVLRQVLATGGAPIALEDDDIISGLVTAGVLVPADAPSDLVSRRSFVSAAAAVGAIGIVTLALPRAAAASSGEVNPGATPPNPDPVVSASLTGIEYPGVGQAGQNEQQVVGVRWRESTAVGGGPFTFRVVITGSTGSFAPVTVTGLASGLAYTYVHLPSWAVGETIFISYRTTSLLNNVDGQLRDTTRNE